MRDWAEDREASSETESAKPGEPRPTVPRFGVVLAAGASQRLQSVTGGGSKALVRLGGMTLIERAVFALFAAGVKQVLVVVGHHAGSVATVAKEIRPGSVGLIHADDWEAGNGASLAAAEKALKGESLFALVTTDHIFSEEALGELLRAGEPAVLADLHPKSDAWLEGTRIRIQDGRALSFGKEIKARGIDCGAFLLPRAVFGALRSAAPRSENSLAAGLTRLVRTTPLRVVPLPNTAWWQDIDTPEDLRLARIRLRRSLMKSDDGPVSRLLNRPVSTRISMALAALRPSPNLLSLVAFSVGLGAAWMLYAGRAVEGAVAAHLASVLDGVDGEIARLTFRSSPKGALMDGILDRICDVAIVGALGAWGVFEGAPAVPTLLLSVAATTGSMLSMSTKDRITALGLRKPPERALGLLMGGRDGRLLIVAAASLVGSPTMALWLVVSTSAIASFTRITMTRGEESNSGKTRRRSKPDKPGNLSTKIDRDAI